MPTPAEQEQDGRSGFAQRLQSHPGLLVLARHKQIMCYPGTRLLCDEHTEVAFVGDLASSAPASLAALYMCEV